MNENPKPDYRQRPAPRFIVWGRRMLFALVCLITLVALFYAEENWRGARAWRQQRGEWAGRGVKLEVNALVPPAIPDDKNLAMGALLKPLFNYSYGPTRAIWADTNGLARLDHFSPNLNMGARGNRDLALGNLELGTFADFDGWEAFYRGNTNYPQANAGATPVEVVLTALGGLDPEYKQLREEAAARPELRFPVPYDTQPALAILLPHVPRVRLLVSYLNVRAVAELEAGQPDEAFADLMLAFRISEGISREPILISHLVRIATLAINLQTMREGLMRHAWTDAQLADFEKYLGAQNLLKELKMALVGELALSTSSLDFIRQLGFSGGKTFAAYTGNGSADLGLNLMPGGWYYQNMVTLSKLFRDYVIPAVDVNDQRVFPDATRKADATVIAMSKSPYTVFARMLMPAMDRAVAKSARAQVMVDEARLACALEWYRIAHKQLPDELSALVPVFIGKVPHDIIDGQPLRYRREADGGYILYSVGWNVTDDHGTLVLKKSQHNVDSFEGDWVWQMPGNKPVASHR